MMVLIFGYDNGKNGEKGGQQMSNLKIIRERRGLTQAQLAQLSGVSLQTIQEFEQEIPPMEQQAQMVALHQLATALSCNITDIL